MKKRLLSAALALAMVLTMLPLTAFAATTDSLEDNDSGKYTVTYRDAGYVFKAADKDGNGEIKAPTAGWYFYGKKEGAASSDPNTLYQASDGVIVGSNGATSGKWYKDANSALEDGKASSIRLIGNTNEVDLGEATYSGTISIDTNGKELTLSGELKKNQASADDNTSCTGLTLTSSAKGSDGKTVKGTVGGEITATTQSFTFKATDIVAATGGGVKLTLDNSSAKTTQLLTVNLTRAAVGDITTKLARVDIDLLDSECEAGAIKVSDGLDADTSFDIGASDININGGTTGAITFNGEGNVKVADMGKVDGVITLFGGGQTTANNKTTAWKWNGSIKVTVTSRATVTGIAQNSGDTVVSHTVEVSDGATVGNSGVVLNKGTGHKVTVNGATAALVTLNGGTLDITEGATIGGAVTLGGADDPATKVTVNISDKNNKGTSVGSIVEAPSSKSAITLNVSGGDIGGNAAPTTTNFTKNTITGGTFGFKVPQELLDTKLGYQISSGGRYTYTSDFQKLIDAYAADGNAAIVVRAAISAADNDLKSVTFEDSKGNPLVIIKGRKNDLIGPLPSVVNREGVSTWMAGKTPYNAGTSYQISDTADQKLTTLPSNVNSIDEITDVTYGSGTKGVTATLNGNVITLSGAVDTSGGLPLVLTLAVKGTQANTTGTINVVYHEYPTKQVLFQVGTLSEFDAIVGDSGTTLTIPGSITYTLSYANLKAQVGSVKIATSGIKPEATISVSGLTTAVKEDLKKALESQVQTDLVTSAPIIRAANAQMNTLTDSAVLNLLDNAWQQKAKEDNKTKEYNTREKRQTAYGATLKEVTIVPYLSITARGWTRTGSGSVDIMTLDISLRYKYQVSDNIKAYDVGSGALTAAADSTNSIAIKFKLPGGFGSVTNGSVKNLYVRHKNYVYTATVGTDDVVSFNNYHGFSTFEISGVKPTVTMKDKVTGGQDVGYGFDSLQLAVDEVKDGYKIALASNYAGPYDVSTSGAVREFTVDATKITGSAQLTFAGADYSNKNGTYTVQVDGSAPANAKIGLGTANNGKASLNATSAKAGSKVTVTLMPDSGYRSLAPTVKTNTGATVSVSGSGNTYTFTVPDGATSITVTPSFVLASTLPFTDVADTTAWYYDGVAYCYNNNLMQGYDGAATTFGINHAVTRAEVVTILWRLEGQPKETPRTTYTDVKSGEWHYDAIAWATNHGYAKGYGDGRFGPNNPVQRQELAVFLHRYAGSPTVSANLGAYSDGQGVADWALAAMRWATSYSILSGTNSVSLNGRLDAYSTAYRSQVAVTLQRFHQYYK